MRIAVLHFRTQAHLRLPSGESFDLEYVKGTPWNAYNWYKGNFRSVIQVNLDFPIPLDRAVDLGLAVRVGSGEKSDPYRYAVAG